jgi:hypothetical protein
VVTVRVRPTTPGTLSIYVAPDSGTVRSLRVDGMIVSTARFRGSAWPLQYVAPRDSGFTLAFEIPAGGHVVLGATSRVPGVPIVDGLTVPQRPAGVIPIQYPDITVAHKTLRI